MPDSPSTSLRSWTSLVTMCGLVPLAGVAMEWLFFATKPSFLSPLQTGERIGALFSAIALPALLGLAVGALLAALSRAAGKPAFDRVARAITALLLATAATAIALLVIDNFTLTVLHFGVRDAGTFRRVVYVAALAVILLLFYRSFWRAKEAPRGRAAGIAAAVVAAVALGGLLWGVVGAGRINVDTRVSGGSRPNVIILGSDGVNARQMSLYGNERETTPFLNQLAAECLVADNAFSNSAHTGGSLTSILTARLPSTTGVVYPPDILRGADAYRHLPGLLKSRGYSTLQLTVRHYGDAYDLNILRGFDEVNGRRREDSDIQTLARIVGDDAAYLLVSIRERIVERVRHIAGIEAIRDVFEEVTSSPAGAVGDAVTLARLEEFITSTEDPIFAHVHLMGTHGPQFFPSVRRYSAGQAQDKDWMLDFYADAVADFDRAIARVVDALRKSGKLENTILVIYSDHGRRYETTVRVPLVIRFPNGRHRGHVETDVQNIDIAPTILDAMGIRPPSWMEGESILRVGRRCRPVFSFAADQLEIQQRGDKLVATGGPLGSLGVVTVVTCDTAFVVSLHRDQTVSVPVRRNRDDHTNCDCGPLDKMRAARMVVDHLADRGMAISGQSAANLASDAFVTRGELARYFVLAKHGQDFIPPDPHTARFEDVPVGTSIHPWVEQFVSDGLASGCRPNEYCPDNPLTRAQLAVIAGSFLGWHRSEIDGPSLTDIGNFKGAEYFIRRAVGENLLRPCGEGKFCPGEPVTRDQLMIVMRRLSERVSGKKS